MVSIHSLDFLISNQKLKKLNILIRLNSKFCISPCVWCLLPSGPTVLHVEGLTADGLTLQNIDLCLSGHDQRH